MLCTWKQRSAQVVDTDEHRESTDPSTRRREPCTARSCRHTDSRVRILAPPTTVRASAGVVSSRECGKRFTTVETAALSVVAVRRLEPFSRAKVLVGVRKACQGRPVTEDDLALLAQRVEETIRGLGQAEVDAHEVGLAVLELLRELDEVAYLRFASVYQAFTSLEDFEAAITLLRAERPATAEEPTPRT